MHNFNVKHGGALSNHILTVVMPKMSGTESRACHVARIAEMNNM